MSRRISPTAWRPGGARRAIRMTGVAASLTMLAACTEQPIDYYPGYAEGEYVRLAAPISGTVVKLSLQRGDQAAAGAAAFVLEQESERAAREEASSRVQHAVAQLANLNKGKRPDEIAAARAQLAQAQAALALSNADLMRQKQLVAQKFISAARLDEARVAVERDQARSNEMRAQLRVAQLGARADEIAAAEEDLKAAQAQLAQAEWRVLQKTQRVPSAGVVVDVIYREGEWVAAGTPVLTLLPAQNIKARFFVSEPALGSIHLGQPVWLQCDGCGAPMAARISYISPSAEYTAPIIYSKENRATLVFLIEARPAPDDARRLHPGQPLEVRLKDAAPKERP